MWKGKLLCICLATLCIVVAGCQAPADSAAGMSLVGSSQSLVILCSGEAALTSLTSDGGITDASCSTVPANTHDFNVTASLGTLSSGSGGDSVLQIAVRSRSNTPIKVVTSVSAYTVNGTISYKSTTLTSGQISDLSFLKTSQGPPINSSGSLVNPTVGATYNSAKWPPAFTEAVNLSNLNGSIAPASSASATFISSRERVSLGGGFNSPHNFIESYARFGIETGLAWGGTGSFSVTIDFEIVPNP